MPARSAPRRRRARLQLHALLLLACLLSPICLMIAAQTSPPDTVEGRPGASRSAPASDSLSSVEPEDWRLILVGPKAPLPELGPIRLTQLRNGQSVDSRCYPDLQEMMDACRAEGLAPLICSSYRTLEDQEQLYEAKVAELLAQGCAPSEAQAEAGKIVAPPGTSEHQLGLAVDIVDTAYQNLDEAQEATAVQIWLMEHCWEYGFILRYPTNKSEITGIIYEPWHYRYVGREAAKDIHRLEICLEEYIQLLEATTAGV